MISINGVSYSGKDMTIVNGKVTIDGKDMTPGDAKQINITVNGNIDSLSVDSCQKVSVIGNAGSVRSVSGDITVSSDVQGNVETVSGDVKCHDVHGNVRTVSGDIRNSGKAGFGGSGG